MAVIKKEKGEGVAVALIVNEIGEFVQRFNQIRPMENFQVIEFARLLLITEPFFCYKIGDFQLCFLRARQKRYLSVKILDRMAEDILMDFLLAYDAERTNHFVGGSIDTKKGTEKEFNTTAEKMLYLLPAMKKVQEGLESSKVQETPEKGHPLPKNEGTDIAQKIFEDFDRIFKDQGGGSGIRTIRIGNDIFDQESYFEFRIKNL